ncbi:MAG TPA: GNAT family N-acetyltransferase, partial [Acidimicrobiia bacterium]|nr:GNAT family N-acetyltransferase [Acidimicrobiia bacterium]
AGFDRLSAGSRYRRFLAPIPRMTDSMLAFLTSVDGVNHRAWGALVDEPTGPVGAGVVRWVRTNADPVVADLAVTVIDDYQGRGLGGLLLDVAVLDAFAHGLDRFEGIVLGENISSRRMLARGGATLRPDGGGVLAFTLPLRARVDRLRSSPLPGLLARQSGRALLT